MVEGIAAYYPRFGFERASALGFLFSPHPKIPDEAFMVKRLPGYSPDLAGRIVYPATFDALGTNRPSDRDVSFALRRPQGGSGGHRPCVRRRARPGVPSGHRRARARAIGSELRRIPPGYRFPYGHTHKTQEEVYVVVRGSGRMKLDDEIVELEEWDAVRVPPEHGRGYEAGPKGLEILVIGAPGLGRIGVKTSTAGATGGQTSSPKPFGWASVHECHPSSRLRVSRDPNVSLPVRHPSFALTQLGVPYWCNDRPVLTNRAALDPKPAEAKRLQRHTGNPKRLKTWPLRQRTTRLPPIGWPARPHRDRLEQEGRKNDLSAAGRHHRNIVQQIAF